MLACSASPRQRDFSSQKECFIAETQLQDKVVHRGDAGTWVHRPRDPARAALPAASLPPTSKVPPKTPNSR